MDNENLQPSANANEIEANGEPETGMPYQGSSQSSNSSESVDMDVFGSFSSSNAPESPPQADNEDSVDMEVFSGVSSTNSPESPHQEDNDDDEEEDDDEAIEGSDANVDADMSEGIRLITELNALNALLNDLSGRASRIAEHLGDAAEGSSRSPTGPTEDDLQAVNVINNAAEPVRALVGQVFRRISAGEVGISDSVLARLRRMVFRLDGRLQRRGLQLGEEYRLSNSQSSNGTSNESQHDDMSDDEPPPPNAIRFDTNLAAEHSYMGTTCDMFRVSGVNYLDAGNQYNMLLFVHQHLLFPGEILPFMISENVFDDEENDGTNGLLFGVCFPFMPVDQNNPNSDIYGVTCQIYERGTDPTGNMLIKSRAMQRFVYRRSESSVDLQYIASHPRFKCRGNVRILPEIFLPEPLKCINMGSLNRFRDLEPMRDKFRRFQAATTPWPVFVYDHYSITSIVEKARTKLAQHKIDTMPTDPIQLSFWLVRNLHLSEELSRDIFATDSVNIRMKLIAGSFKEDAVFVCRYCGNRIAECRELFAMSKYGVQTQYCNSAGYIHETNTVYRVTQDAISFSGQPSAEFSWFPGYQWHIITCQVCTRHIGWQFSAIDQNLFPKTFYGISSSSVRISARPEIDAEADINNVYRSLVRLARRRVD